MACLKRVLLIDDEADIRTIASLALQAAGMHVFLAKSGLEGVAAAMTGTADLILLDSMMPDMDGLQTIARLQDAGVTTPVVFLTANTRPDDLAAYTASGAIGVVGKPFDPFALPTELRRILDSERLT